MPIEFVYDEKRNLLVTTADGVITFEEIQRHLDNEEAKGYLCLPELFDCNDATTNPSREQVVLFVHRLLNYAKTKCLGPTAVVAKDLVTFGMARMFEIISEIHGGPPIGVFHNREEGEHWLAQFGGADQTGQS